MKTHILILAALAALTTLAAADSPDAILKDYRSRATQATQRLDETLTKQGAQIITSLVRSGDTAGATTVTEQIKQASAGDAIPAPHSAAAKLFAQYTAARTTALQPVQAAALTRLDSLLKVAGGPNLEALAEITKARAEIEAGKLVSGFAIPQAWTYHNTATSATVMAEITLTPDGVFTMSTLTEPGSWKANQKGDTVTITFKDKSTWKMTINGQTAVLDRPDVGKRFMRVKAS